MYLKRLEIHGFKTFADSTEVEFVPGFMAVVGPNGSGKSNLTDAIRYCLGEQSAKVLRACKQEELVFAGTPSRKPALAAEVTATFDNSDGHLPVELSEVAITRKTSKDGDSLYYINRTPCRLRDVHELLMGSGVGPGSFSVLGGKEVDMVLSNDPKDRRLMIEETAGTNRYRFRKKEATRKLEQTNSNLLRLRDILQEVEKNVQDSQQALARYEKYKKVQDQLGALEGRVALTDWQNAQAKQEAGQRLLEACQASSQEADSLEHSLALQLEAQESQRSEQQLKRDELQAELSSTRSALSSAQASIQGLFKRVQQLEVTTHSAKQRLEHSSGRLESRRQELDSLTAELPQLQSAVDSALAQLNSLRAELASHPALCQSPRSSIKEQLAQVERERQRLVGKQESLNVRLEQEQDRRVEAAGEASTLRQEAVTEPTQQLVLEEARQKAAQALAAEKQVQGQKEQAATEVMLSRSKRAEMEKRRRPLANRVMELESVLEDHVGLPPAVRYVLSWKVPGTVGVVSDLIKVREGVETAIEAALGGRLSDIVTADRHTASALIERLRRERAGRVTFWPLDLERRESDPIPLPTSAGVVGQALSLIEYEPQLRPVLKQMLGQTVVMQDLPSALALYDQCRGRRPTLVTLQGEYLSPSGAVTGGSFKTERTGTLARKRQLEEARSSLSTIEKELTTLSSSEEGATLRLQHLEEGLSRARETSRSARQLVQDLEAEWRRVEKETQRSLGLAQKLEAEAKRLEEHGVSLRQELEQTAQSLESLAKKDTDLRLAQARSEEEESKLRSLQEALRRQITDSELKYSSSLGALQEKQRETDRLKGRFCELQEDRATAQRELQEAAVEREALQAEGQQLQETIASLETLQVQQDKELQGLQALNKDRDEALRDLRNAYAKSGKKARECGENLKRQQVECETLAQQLVEAQARWEALKPAQASTELMEPQELDKARGQTRRLRSFLENFGSVNLGAREDFDRLSARRDELQKQLDDLEEATGSLKLIISEMDKASIKQFSSVFTSVNQTFSRLFTEIFGGGWAKLELVNPDDPLESGVEIVACPPGKKLQNLLLFSSGERALSAIAFLLSLLTHKPSPIVVLDELDAPLDDSNVEKIAGRLLEFSSSSQFLVITHNRKTMEFANRLYGVTMEDPGISRLLTVELNEAQGQKYSPSQLAASSVK